MVRGAQIFVPQSCPACGAIQRVRDQIGGYTLQEPLARSGLGVVFRAFDADGTPLAVKILQPPLASMSEDLDYFASEVWAVARLNHPNCVRIFATGVEQGAAWIAMEWLAHGSLAARLAERGRLREAEVLAIGRQAATALGAAHAAGHTHRDLEPNNLVFADPLTIKVTDFGQAALYQLAAAHLGAMWGLTSYVAPERLRNEPEEAPSDIYSLGAVLFHALTGTPLRGGEPNGLVTLTLLESEEVRVEEFVDGLHDQTASVLNRMLIAEPTQRFQHWSEVVAQLTKAGTLLARRETSANVPPPPPWKSADRMGPRPAGLRSLLGCAVLVLVLLALIAGVGLVAWKQRLHPGPPAPAGSGHP